MSTSPGNDAGRLPPASDHDILVTIYTLLVNKLSPRQDDHEQRIRRLERAVWIATGVAAAIGSAVGSAVGTGF